MYVQIDDVDKYLYVGTTSGDVIIINLLMRKLRGTLPPVKKRFNMGVTAIGQFKSGEFVVGAGDGLVCLCDPLFNRTESVFENTYFSDFKKHDFLRFFEMTCEKTENVVSKNIVLISQNAEFIYFAQLI